MADALFELTSGSDAWASAQALGLSARSVHITNRGSFPVRVRWASSGDAIASVAAGAARLFVFPRSAVKTTVALFGIGGASAVDVEASTDELQTTLGGASGSLVVAELSSGTPAALGSATAGSAATASRSDHAHALPAGSTVASAIGTASAGSSSELARVDHVHPVGAISASLGTETSNKRRVTYTGLGTNPLHLTLRTATGALADGGSNGQSIELVTGTTAAWSLSGGSSVMAIITPSTGSVVVDVNDKSAVLNGSVWLSAEQPATGAHRTDQVAFT
jgi:hypothetical protein